MQLEMTFDDPKTYRKPFTIKVPVNFVPDDDLIENVCLENEKDRARLIGRIADERKTEPKIPASALSQYSGSNDVGPLVTRTVTCARNEMATEFENGGTSET